MVAGHELTDLDPWVEGGSIGGFEIFLSFENDLVCLACYKRSLLLNFPV